MSLQISTKNGTERELQMKAFVEKIIAKYPYPHCTDRIVIEEKVRSHSHPVLTLNTRIFDEFEVYATLVHEQFHWFFVGHARRDEALTYLKQHYDDLGDCNVTGTYPNSFWEHLVVCWNTRNFLNQVLPADQVESIYAKQISYPKTEPFVAANFAKLESDLQKFDLIYASAI